MCKFELALNVFVIIIADAVSQSVRDRSWLCFKRSVMNPHLNGGSFRYMDGCLWCENVKLKTVKESIERKLGWSGPIFVYSKEQLSNNIKSYLGALLEYNLNFGLGYALKANSNYHLLKIIQQFDCFSVTVSGYEIEMALLAGFRADRIIFNGNGKQNWEIEKAIQNGCLLNIDSIFDVNSISLVAKKLNSKCRILVRINPDLDAKVHPHNCTALAHSKFGIELKQFDAVVNKILENNESLILVGIHSHIGSTVDDVSLYEDVCRVLLEIAHKLRDLGFAELKFINIGGGLGIDYTKQDSTFPLAKDLIKKISHLFHHEDFMLLLEPGR